MEELVAKAEVPALPSAIRVQSVSRGALPGGEIPEISPESIGEIVEKVRSGECPCLMMSPDACGEEGYLMLESSPERIFLQIWDAESETAWACFDPAFLDSDEDAPIEPSDGQSVFPMKCTMRDRALAARCVEWYAHTLQPYPGMEWLKESFG